MNLFLHSWYFFVNSVSFEPAKKKTKCGLIFLLGWRDKKSVKRDDSDVCHFHSYLRLLFISFGGDVDTTLFKFRALFSAVEPDDELLLLPMLLLPLQLFNVCLCAILVRSATSSGEQTLSYVSFFNAPFNWLFLTMLFFLLLLLNCVSLFGLRAFPLVTSFNLLRLCTMLSRLLIFCKEIVAKMKQNEKKNWKYTIF